MMPASRKPVIHVHAAPQRNQKSARGSSSGLTTFLVGPSIFPWKGPLTQLKKYRCPIQVIPAKMCSHLNIASNPAMSESLLSRGRRYHNSTIGIYGRGEIWGQTPNSELHK